MDPWRIHACAVKLCNVFGRIEGLIVRPQSGVPQAHRVRIGECRQGGFVPNPAIRKELANADTERICVAANQCLDASS